VLTLLASPDWLDSGASATWSWARGLPLGEWLMSPGFGGTAALAAALIALRGVRRTVTAQREANRKQQWWDRAKWALDLLLEDDYRKQIAGLEVLAALADSEWAFEHEADFVDAAVRPFLDAYLSRSGLNAISAEDEPRSDDAHLKQDDENGESA
jgi:hypothetical protein